MSTLMDTLLSGYVILALWILSPLFIDGKHHGSISSCEVEVNVRRGTVLKAVPQHRLTVNCTVEACGKLLNITWCKILDMDNMLLCRQINNTENIKMRQVRSSLTGKLTSFLDFKRISMHDDGLYRCEPKGSKDSVIAVSHAVNISVSDTYQLEMSNTKTSDSPNNEEPATLSWLPYMSICISIVLLVFIVTMLTLLRFNSFKGLTSNNKSLGQEMSTLMLPDLPKATCPSAPVLHQACSNLYDNYVHSHTGTAHSLKTDAGQHEDNTVRSGPGSGHVVYAAIHHLPSETSSRAQHTTALQEEHSEYASIKVS